MPLARNANAAIAAEQTKQQFDEYLRAGFTEHQALELIKAILSASVVAELSRQMKK